MLDIKVNDKYTFKIDPDNHIINDKKNVDWDIIEVNKGQFHLIRENSSYRCQVLNADHAEKKFTIKVNGNVYEVIVKDKFDILLKKLGMENIGTSKIQDIKAPMPGLVLSINVQAGDEIKKGDVVMVLEAMKMENALKASGDGVVKSIEVSQGNAVEKNQVLIRLE